MERRDPYRILQVHVDAELDVIRAAYRTLARRLHPDRGPGAKPDPSTEKRMTDLNWAYALLRDPEARAQYERDRRSRSAASAASASHGASRPDYDYDTAQARLDFGRYEGWTLREVARRDIEYLRWLRRHASGARHRTAIAALLREHDAKGKR
jgi:curved DNA-binding protein CbpA